MPLLWISLSFLAGLVLGEWITCPAAGWFAMSLSALLLWSLLRRQMWLPWLRWMAQRDPRLLVPPVLLAAALFAGAGRMALSDPASQAGHIYSYNGAGPARIIALVVAPPDRTERSTMLRVQVETITPLGADGQPGETFPARGLIQVMLLPGAGWQYGDRLLLEGSPTFPPEDEEFSYRAYLARQNVHTYLPFPRVRRLERDAGSSIFAVVYRLRDWAYAEIYRLFPAPEAPLLAGILLGIERDLPESVERAFQDTGTAHVIAISGFNIAILVNLFMSLFRRVVSRWWAMAASILAIAVYTLLVGATPSVVRAAWMGSMALIADQIGRRSTGANSLGLTAAVMCIGNPHLPWDVSFQLSFTATLGLILYGERMQNAFERWLSRPWRGRQLTPEQVQRIAGPVGEYFLMTLAAQSLTLPVILYHFQRLSLSALIANPLILPVQPLLMTLSGAAVLAGAVWGPLAQVLAWLAWPLSAYTIRAVELLAMIPSGAVSIGEPGLGGLALMFTAVSMPLIRDRLPNVWKSILRPAVLLIALSLIAVVVMRAALSVPDGRLHLLVADIDGSQVVLLRAPRGETVLIGGGPSVRQLPDLLGRWLSPFDRTIDALIINDPASAALSGLPAAMERYTVGQAFWGCLQPDNRAARDVAYALEDREIPSHTFSAGEALRIGDSLTITALAASGTGSTLIVEYGSFRALLPAGVAPGRLPPEKVAQPALVLLSENDLDSAPLEGWQALAPQAVIVTASDPALTLPNYWLATHPGEWLAVTTDGTQMWLERGR